MNSIEFGKKCRPYNVQYRDVFGYVPCRDDYDCSQDKYFEALLKAIETKCELSAIVPEKNKEFQEPDKNLRTNFLRETVCAHIEHGNEADVILQKAGVGNGVAAECAEIQDSGDFL